MGALQSVLNTWHLCNYQLYNLEHHRRMEARANPDAAATATAATGPSPQKRPRTTAAARPQPAGDAAAPGAAAAEEEIRRPRILVCAPSNAATDELLSRVLKDKFVDVHGARYEPKAVRMGSESANMSAEAKQVRAPSLTLVVASMHTRATHRCTCPHRRCPGIAPMCGRLSDGPLQHLCHPGTLMQALNHHRQTPQCLRSQRTRLGNMVCSSIEAAV